MGRGRGDPHSASSTSAIPVVGTDYFFITNDSVVKRDELLYPATDDGEAELEKDRASGEVVKCLIVRDTSTKCLFGHVVPCKGADEEDYAANLVVNDIAWLGHTELVINGDNEPALQALIARTLEVVRVKSFDVKKITTENPPAYVSQSNGGVETGVRLIRGLFRTLRLCLEARIGHKIPINHAFIPWLLEHTCFLPNVKSQGDDWLTS